MWLGATYLQGIALIFLFSSDAGTGFTCAEFAQKTRNANIFQDSTCLTIIGAENRLHPHILDSDPDHKNTVCASKDVSFYHIE